MTVSDGGAQAEDFALGADGTAAVAFEDGAVTSNVLLAVRRPGTAWPAAAVVSTPADGIATHPSVAVGGTGQVDVAWSTPSGVFDRRTRATGTSETNFEVSDSLNPNTPTSVAIAANAAGTVAVTWTQGLSGPDRVFVRIRPAGGSWGPIKQVSADPSGASDYSYGAKIAVAANGDVVVGWLQGTGVLPNPHIARLTAGASSFTSTPLGSDQTNGVLLAADSAGDAVLTWVDNSFSEAKAIYWPRASASADPVHSFGIESTPSEHALPGFTGLGAPAVAVLTGSNPTRTLTLWKRATDGSLLWTALPLASGDMTGLALASNGLGRLTVAMRNSTTAGLETAGVSGATIMPFVPINGGTGFATPSVAMSPAGDTLFGWYGFTTASPVQQVVGVTPFDVSGPVTTLNALPVWTLTPATTLHWAARDTWATSATSVLRRNSVVVATTDATSRAVGVPTGTTACFTVQATDPSANTGAQSAARCTAAPLDDRALTKSTGWRKITGTAYYAGTTLVAKHAGRTLTKTVSARRLALVASTCGTCGAVKVYVNGHLVKKISLHGTARNKVVFTIATYTSRRSVKVKLVTTSASKVVVDGLGASTT